MDLNYKEKYLMYKQQCEEQVEYILQLQARLEVLENENQILNQSVKDTYDTSQEIIYELKQENEKLKKAIEILKDKFAFKLKNNKLEFLYNYQYFELTKQEYELLKEVLGDV
jgi:protein-tyrosine phosphatase